MKPFIITLEGSYSIVHDTENYGDVAIGRIVVEDYANAKLKNIPWEDFDNTTIPKPNNNFIKKVKSDTKGKTLDVLYVQEGSPDYTTIREAVEKTVNHRSRKNNNSENHIDQDIEYLIKHDKPINIKSLPWINFNEYPENTSETPLNNETDYPGDESVLNQDRVKELLRISGNAVSDGTEIVGIYKSKRKIAAVVALDVEKTKYLSKATSRNERNADTIKTVYRNILSTKKSFKNIDKRFITLEVLVLIIAVIVGASLYEKTEPAIMLPCVVAAVMLLNTWVLPLAAVQTKILATRKKKCSDLNGKLNIIETSNFKIVDVPINGQQYDNNGQIANLQWAILNSQTTMDENTTRNVLIGSAQTICEVIDQQHLYKDTCVRLNKELNKEYQSFTDRIGKAVRTQIEKRYSISIDDKRISAANAEYVKAQSKDIFVSGVAVPGIYGTQYLNAKGSAREIMTTLSNWVITTELSPETILDAPTMLDIKCRATQHFYQTFEQAENAILNPEFDEEVKRSYVVSAAQQFKNALDFAYESCNAQWSPHQRNLIMRLANDIAYSSTDSESIDSQINDLLSVLSHGRRKENMSETEIAENNLRKEKVKDILSSHVPQNIIDKTISLWTHTGHTQSQLSFNHHSSIGKNLKLELEKS